ncbi:MAG: ATP-binding cassette domain-containing protein, partial [Deltaproteobacteria bacterium]|nr:ATP-binding cassette domain-containing protein [Deltaproteobacteria bacterium]
MRSFDRVSQNRVAGPLRLGVLPLRVPILVAENLRKSYGEVTLLDGVNLSIHEGERVGLVGSNGAGKSTLARILLGIETAD